MNRSSTTVEENVLLAARAEAAAWITRLHGPERTEETEAGFRRWLAERPENAAEFEGLTEVWSLVGGLPARGAPRMTKWNGSELARDESDSPRKSLAPILAYAAVAVLAIGTLLFGAHRFWVAPVYSTAVGEQRIIMLRDGTRVWLNSDTQLRSVYNSNERRVQLEHGEAFFEVVHDPKAPFVVAAGEHQVTALGTSFVVRRESSQTEVTLVEGKVAVAKSAGASAFIPTQEEVTERGGSAQVAETNEGERRTVDGETTKIGKESGDAVTLRSDLHEPASGSNEPIILQPGEKLILAASHVERFEVPRIEAAIAWRRGEVMLDDTPLAKAVAEMNRYNAVPIVIDDADIEALLISGLFHTGDSRDFALTVARLHGLEVETRKDAIHLKSR